MKAIWNDTTIAEASKEDLIYIEGNWYFPAASLKSEYFTASDTHTQCQWKGKASYYNIVVEGKTNEDAAWYYADPMKTAFELTKKDFTNYVAFWKGVEVRD